MQRNELDATKKRSKQKMLKLVSKFIRPFTEEDFKLHILIGIYFFLLLSVYHNILVESHAHQGFANRFDAKNLFISGLCLFSIFLIVRNRQTPSDLFLNLAVILQTVPALVLFVGAGLPALYAAINTFAIITIAVTCRMIRTPPIGTGLIPLRQLGNILVVTSILTAIAIFGFGAYRHLNFDLSKVYSIRGKIAEELPSIFAYISPATTKVAIPFALAISINQKKWLSCLLISVISILFFAITAHKAPLFYPLAVLAIYYLHDRGRTILNILIIAIVAVIICWIDGLIFLKNFGSPFGWAFTLGVRRSLMIPPLVDWGYIQLFQNEGYLLWAESKLSLGLIQSPFDEKTAKVVGKLYFGSNTMSANAGWIGSGYANAGIFGVAAYSILIGTIFSLIDTYAERVTPALLTASFSILFYIMLTSSDLITMFLTHGLLLSLFIMMSIKPTLDLVKT